MHEANLQTVLDMRQGGSMGVQGMKGQAVSALQVLRRNQASSIQVIPFRVAHVRAIMPDANAKVIQSALTAERTGPAWTACLYGNYVGAAGVSVQQPGIGEVWTMFNPTFLAFPIFMHREVKARLAMVLESLDEVWAVCLEDNKWIRRLGFSHVEQAERPELYQKLEPGQSLFVRRK